MKGYPTELSKDVVAQVNGYERRETDGDVVKYYIKADKATTFTDNHQELENVFLQVFDEKGETSDQIKAQKSGLHSSRKQKISRLILRAT